MSHLLTRMIYDCRQPREGDRDAPASLLGSCPTPSLLARNNFDTFAFRGGRTTCHPRSFQRHSNTGLTITSIIRCTTVHSALQTLRSETTSVTGNSIATATANVLASTAILSGCNTNLRSTIAQTISE